MAFHPAQPAGRDRGRWVGVPPFFMGIEGPENQLTGNPDDYLTKLATL